MCSRDILLQAKGDHLGRVHSDQMVLEMIRKRRLSRRAVVQQRPREKISLERKSYSLYLRVTLQKGGMVSVNMIMSENQSSQSQVQVTAFWGTEG
jgi:hypothetical protein